MNKKNDVGVIVGRFQVPSLHSEHKKLFDRVISMNHKVIVFLGIPIFKTTDSNPLNFEMRRDMILEDYPNITILGIQDVPGGREEDIKWSRNLDNKIEEILMPDQKVILYGGRDSFIKGYHGKFRTEILEPERYVSGSEIRQHVKNAVLSPLHFRAGVIWATQNQYPSVLPTVDCLIYNLKYDKILLGRKENESKWRFIGGFSDINSLSYEEDIQREVLEETSIELDIKSFKYLGSLKVNDPRVYSNKYKIKTIIFETSADDSLNFVGDDDITEVKWFPCDSVLPLVEAHKEIWKKFGKQIFVC